MLLSPAAQAKIKICQNNTTIRHRRYHLYLCIPFERNPSIHAVAPIHVLQCLLQVQINLPQRPHTFPAAPTPSPLYLYVAPRVQK